MKSKIILKLLILMNVIFVFISCVHESKIDLIEYASTNCLENVFYDNLSKLQNRIIEHNVKGKHQVYKIFVVSNCSNAKTGSLELRNDTLNLFFNGEKIIKDTKQIKKDSTTITVEEWVEEISDCNCVFKLEYKVKGLVKKNHVVTLNGELINQTKHQYKVLYKKPKYSIINKDTINFIDIYGLKQGLHIFKTKDGKQRTKLKYFDNEKISGLANTYYNFEGFDVVETYMLDKKYSIRKYYKKGKLIKTCDTDGSFDEGTNCRYE